MSFDGGEFSIEVQVTVVVSRALKAESEAKRETAAVLENSVAGPFRSILGTLSFRH